MAEVRTVSATGGHKGAKLARFDLIPPFVLKKLAEHYGRGALKYADHNWRKGYKWSLSHAALMRHLNAFWDGEDLDVCTGHEEDCSFVTNDGEPFEGVPGVSCFNHTGNHHMDGVNFHGFALRYFAEFFPDYDDRFTTVMSKPTNSPEESALLKTISHINDGLIRVNGKLDIDDGLSIDQIEVYGSTNDCSDPKCINCNKVS